MRFLLPVVVSWLVAVASASDSGTTPEALHPLAILRKECATCHSEAKRKGGLLIGSRESLLEGGDTDAAIVPGKAKESLLVETLYPDADSHMPPKGQLTPQEIAAIEAWIDKGAEWDAAYWAKLTLPEKAEVAIGKLPVGYGPIFAVALSPDHRRLAVGRGGQIDWYRVEPDGKQPAGFVLALDRSISAHDDAVQSLAFSPDGKQLASGGFRSVRLWNPDAPEKPVKEFTEPFLGRQTAILHLSDGKRLLVADSLPSQGGRLVEIALDSGAAKTFDNAHLDTVFSLALRADGKQYASTSADKLVTVRDSTTHEIVTRLEGHTGYVLASAFSPEGTRLISAGDDEEIKVWSLESGKKIGALISNRSGPFYALAWLADPAKAKQKA
ncbi:MAG TPA: hypothetical protein PLA50_19045, partial [Bacteroidia bacterium]|nr:hypothetical protein [Bacteroidia bacterium]